MMAADIKLAHSIFALPFAVLAAFLVGPSRTDDAELWNPFWGKLALVVVCMICARTWAMLFNRLADRAFDAANERTKRRVFASGRVSARAGWIGAIAAAACFVGAASLFWVFFGNAWPAILSLPVLAWIAFYSLTKRFTALCHIFLGGALGLSPLAAAVAVDPHRFASTPSIIWLGVFVVFWVAGFDVIYALQDEDFDRARGLLSIPAKMGTRGALWVSRALHTCAKLSLAVAWSREPRFTWVFGVAVVAVSGLLLLEHGIVARRGKEGLHMAFFTVNGIVSCILGALGVADAIW